MSRRRQPRQNKAEYRMVATLDALAEFEAFQDDILPLLRKAIKEGWTREQIDQHPKVQALLAARQITIALKEMDSAKALSAIKDLRDRTQGKPTEKVETTHRMAQLPDEQLDSILLSKLEAAGDDAEPDQGDDDMLN